MDSQFLGSAVEMLILEVAGQGPTYGYELAQTVGERSNGYFELKEGSLYPALHRLERQKLLRSFWRRGGRPPAQVLRADRSRPHRAGFAQEVVAELHGRRQRRAGHRVGSGLSARSAAPSGDGADSDACRPRLTVRFRSGLRMNATPMDFRDTLSALLPPPRDDEPASLRQDILDELGDHLACAYNRELLRGVDSSVARQRVLERFGDPAAVARRLWLDAMKGKIMAQRVLIATCLVVMLACGASVGLAWQLDESGSVAQEPRGGRSDRSQSADVRGAGPEPGRPIKEMLKQMREMTEAVLHPVSPDWNPVTFKLTEETADGPPAAGFSLALTRLEGTPGRWAGRREQRLATGLPCRRRTPHGANYDWFFHQASSPRAPLASSAAWEAWAWRYGRRWPAEAIYRTSDTSGVADFGAVQPGDYRFQIPKSWANGYFRPAANSTSDREARSRSRLFVPRHRRIGRRCACDGPGRPISKGATGALCAFRFPLPQARARSGMDHWRSASSAAAKTTIESGNDDGPGAVGSRRSLRVVRTGDDARGDPRPQESSSSGHSRGST